MGAVLFAWSARGVDCGGDTSGGDYYAPGCQLLSSSVQPYPQQVQQSLPQCLQPFKGPMSSFESLQRRAKLSRMLAGSPSLGSPRRLKGVITFLEDLKNFWRHSDREWIVIILLSISIPKTFSESG